MEGSATSTEKDCGALGGLFQSIINDLRGSSPIWEDFASKSMKLHTTLKATVVAIGGFLEAFQKVADMATGSNGATKEIGSALTRLCMRHRSIETHLKSFTSSIVDSLVVPIQDKLEDWKKAVAQLDKEHAKEQKKARHDIKKAASDTIRLQKKARKGSGSHHGHKADLQAKLGMSVQEVNAKYAILEDTEKTALRSALIEERSRFCHFITCLKPFVDGELKLLTEISHIEEIMHALCMQASEPTVLPPSSEQVILDLKGLDNNTWNFNQPSPPSSPSSLGSRKSSMCSINSINSQSSSGSSKSHSPSHTLHKRTPSQAVGPGSTVRLTSVSSQDSGFTSQDTLFLRPQTPPHSLNLWKTSSAGNAAETLQTDGDCDSTPTTPSDSTPSASSTWNNWPNPPSAGSNKMDTSRPHTISSAYEKAHGRPALKPDMFEPPSAVVEMRSKPARQHTNSCSSNSSIGSTSSSASHHRTSASISKLQPVLPPHCPKAKVTAVAPPSLPPVSHQPIYANTSGISQTSPDDGEPTTPTTPAGMTQVFPQSPRSCEVNLQQLDQAFEEMVGIAGIPEEEEAMEDGQEVITPRASTSSIPESPIISVLLDPTGEPHKSKTIQPNTSLELAKAIRELEASTAALTSAYDDHDPFPTPASSSSATTATNGGGSSSDADSYTSRSSLPCSSGYATLTSTPAGSKDTVASAGSQPANCPKNGDSLSSQEEEVDMEGNPYPSLTRRSSSSGGPKPPPPIRRTSSVKSGTGQQRPSPQRQMSEGQAAQQVNTARPPDGPYAELQLIQNNIQQQQLQQHQVMGPPAPPGMAKYSSANPPAVKQKPKMVVPPPPSVTSAMQQQQQQHSHVNNNSNNYSNDHHINASIPTHQPQRTLSQPHHQQHPYHHQQQQQQQQLQQQQRVPQTEDEFPLPPTIEELREMERIYSCPSVGPHPVSPSPNTTHHHHHHQPHHPPTTKPPQPAPTIQAKPQAPNPQVDDQQQQQSLMQELKRRVSVDTTSSDA